MKKKNKKIILETFRPITDYEINHLTQNEPSCFNMMVRVEKYKITVEKIEEPLDIIHKRLEKLWIEEKNYHNYAPLIQEAKKHNYIFKEKFGSKKQK